LSLFIDAYCFNKFDTVDKSFSKLEFFILSAVNSFDKFSIFMLLISVCVDASEYFLEQCIQCIVFSIISKSLRLSELLVDLITRDISFNLYCIDVIINIYIIYSMVLDFSNAFYEGRNFARQDLGLDLRDAEFEHSNLTGSSFEGKDLSRANFKGVIAPWSYFSNVTAERADFENCSMYGARFTRSRITNSFFDNASLEFSFFWRATLNGTTFENSNLKNSFFRGANLKNVNFKNANLRDANLENTNIIGANFTGADLTGALFIGAIGLDRAIGLDLTGVILREEDVPPEDISNNNEEIEGIMEMWKERIDSDNRPLEPDPVAEGGKGKVKQKIMRKHKKHIKKSRRNKNKSKKSRKMTKRK
jgi:uncharacterized protein YjbI with pentapeptide repeats